MTQKIDVYLPTLLKRADARAMQAISLYARGAEHPFPPGEDPPPPSPADCKRVLDWIINEACRYYDNGFCMNDPNGRIGAWMDGRQYVAKQIIMAQQLKPEVLKD
jgi:hypothetical protein